MPTSSSNGGKSDVMRMRVREGFRVVLRWPGVPLQGNTRRRDRHDAVGETQQDSVGEKIVHQPLERSGRC